MLFFFIYKLLYCNCQQIALVWNTLVCAIMTPPRVDCFPPCLEACSVTACTACSPLILACATLLLCLFQSQPLIQSTHLLATAATDRLARTPTTYQRTVTSPVIMTCCPLETAHHPPTKSWKMNELLKTWPKHTIPTAAKNIPSMDPLASLMAYSAYLHISILLIFDCFFIPSSLVVVFFTVMNIILNLVLLLQ